jgi:PASTA domain
MRIAALRRTATTSVLTIVATAVIAVVAPPAFAQATRTWVSGVGDDVNPCSRTAPCKTFAGAISKTAAGGVINTLDGAGFGAVTITKSITIDGTGTQASILSLSTNGVNINGAGIDVVLRNIDINGTLPGAGCGGLSGVNVLAASSVRLDGVTISGMQRGVSLPLTNANADVFVDVSLNDIEVKNTCVAGIDAQPAAGKQTRLVLDGARISTSNQALLVGAGAEAWVTGSNLSLNNVGLVASGGAEIHDMCGNTMVGNATDSSFSDVAAECAPVVIPPPVVTPAPTPEPVVITSPPVVTTVSVPTPAVYCVVPKLKGLRTSAATAALTKAGCAVGKVSRKKAGASKKGKVLIQAIPAATSVKQGTKVAIKIGK